MKIELYQYLFSHCQFHRKDCWVSRTANVAWAFDSPFPKQPSNHKSPRTYCRLHLGDTNDIPENKVTKNTYKHQLGLPNATNPASDPGLGKRRSRWSMDFCRCDINKNTVNKGKMWQNCSSIIREDKNKRRQLRQTHSESLQNHQKLDTDVWFEGTRSLLASVGSASTPPPLKPQDVVQNRRNQAEGLTWEKWEKKTFQNLKVEKLRYLCLIFMFFCLMFGVYWHQVRTCWCETEVMIFQCDRFAKGRFQRLGDGLHVVGLYLT